MNLKLRTIISAIAGSAIILSCSSGRKQAVVADATTGATTSVESTSDSEGTIVAEQVKGIEVKPTRPRLILPKATLYKTSGDYRNNVPIQLNADGSLRGYPAPTDIPENPEAITLDNGWLLCPIGVSANSWFTSYTYDEYRALSNAPTREEILKAVIPGSQVTETLEAPMTPAEALADPAAVNAYIASKQLKISQ